MLLYVSILLCFSGYQISSGDRHGALRGSRGCLRLAGRNGSVVPIVQEQRPRSQHVQHGQLGYVSFENHNMNLLLHIIVIIKPRIYYYYNIDHNAYNVINTKPIK